MFTHIRKSLTILALLVCVSSVVRAQNHTQTLSVTNSPLTITADGTYTQILVRENAASPTAVFSITLAGSATALNYPAGTQFIFYGNFVSGQAIGTITATTSGPFSFVAVESTTTPSQSVKNTIPPGGGGGNGTLTQVNTSAPLGGGPITVTGTITCVTCALTTNGGTLTATAPVTISAAGVIAITGVAGEVLAGASPAFTATPVLGVDGSVAGTLQLANSAAAFHTILGSVATANNTVAFFATAPATGDLIECVTASTTCTLTDTGVLASALVTASSTTTFTNKSLSLNQLTGAAAATTITEAATGDALNLVSAETANLTEGYSFTNSCAGTNTCIVLGVIGTGTSTAQKGLLVSVNDTNGGSNIAEFDTGCAVSSAGLTSGCTQILQIQASAGTTLKGVGSMIVQSTSGSFSIASGTGSNIIINSADSTFMDGGVLADAVVQLVPASGTQTGNLLSAENHGNTVLASIGPNGILGSPSLQVISGADYTNSTTTPSTLWAWTLPPTVVAKNYAYFCSANYESTAASLGGLVLGINISAAPTQVTATAKIESASAGTNTKAHISNATTGAQSVLTGATALVTSTYYEFIIYGNIEAAPIAGSTFTITGATTSNTTTTINVPRGSSCLLHATS